MNARTLALPPAIAQTRDQARTWWKTRAPRERAALLAAAALGFAHLAGLAHRMEDVLTLMKSGALAITPPLLDTLFAGSDRMAEMVAAIGRGEGDGTVDADGVVEELGRWVPGRQGPGAAAAAPPAAPAAAAEEALDPRARAAFLADAEDLSQKLSDLLAALEPGAVAAPALDEIYRAAHSLKGLAANFGAREVVAHASQLEALGKSGRLKEAEGTLTELEGEIDRLEQALAPFRAASTGDVATPAN